VFGAEKKRIVKKLYAYFCAIGLTILVIICVVKIDYFPTDVLSFSSESGFYDEEFFLEMYAPAGSTIFYTLDSSDPNENSQVYTEPILITDASNNENVYSMITDVTPDYRKDLLNQANVGSYGYELPSENIDKATVVKAIAVDADGNRSEICTGVYWVGFNDKDAYDDINIISIITDPNNLFDYEDGIYVMGRVFENNLVNGQMITPIDPNIGWWIGNYTQRGREWEKEAEVSLWNHERELIYSGKLGLRIQGGSSRGFANKSLNLFARKEYGADKVNGQNIFQNGFVMGSMNLYCGAHGTAKCPDYLVNTVATDLNISTREFQPYMLFLDGEFWGVYWLMPRYEEEYFETNYNVYGDNVVAVKLGYVEIGQTDDIDLYYDMVAWISSSDMSIPENYRKANELIDIDSCLDYYATEIYIANVDWPINNVALWRTRDVASGKYSDGKWRWVLYDVNLSMESQNAYGDWVEYAAVKDDMFASLLYSDEFESALEERLVYLAQNYFNPDKINPFIDNYEASMADAMELEYKRFYGDNRTIDDFYNGCENIRLFFNERYQYVMETYGGW